MLQVYNSLIMNVQRLLKSDLSQILNAFHIDINRIELSDVRTISE
jgi:hypothetical protein